MASAERVVPTPSDEIVLTLSMEEAKTLHLVCGEVQGSYEGRRGHTSAIFYALSEAGVPLDLTSRPRGYLNFDGKRTDA